MAEALALGRPLDQAGDVGHGVVGLVVGPDHAQVGLEGGERVVGDLGLGRRDPRDQGRLAHVGEADQGHVGHQGQLEVVPLLVALLALLGEGGGPAVVGQEAGVAPAAPAALAGQPPVARVGQVGQDGAVGPCGPGCPTGTGTSRSVPRLPCFFLPPPWPPFSAPRWGWSRKGSSEDWLVVATSQTLPPRPPSPPSGPPLSTWASRRMATAPAPPSPAFTWSCASSTKPDMGTILPIGGLPAPGRGVGC